MEEMWYDVVLNLPLYRLEGDQADVDDILCLLRLVELDVTQHRATDSGRSNGRRCGECSEWLWRDG